MNFKSSLTFNGRPFDSGEFQRHLMQRVTESANSQIKERISNIRCPDHGSSAHVTPSADGAFNVKGCCQKLIDLVKQSF
jgi:hypothetical protein